LAFRVEMMQITSPRLQRNVHAITDIAGATQPMVKQRSSP
jgi:hypothetical protein